MQRPSKRHLPTRLRRRIPHRTPCRHMYLTATCPFHNFEHIERPQPAASRQDLYPLARPLDQLSDQLHSLRYRVFLPAGQNPCDPDVHQLLQPFERIRRNVKRPMKNRLPLADQLPHPFRAPHVNPAVALEYSEHYAVGAAVDRSRRITFHRGELSLGVAESPAPRTHHRHHWNLQPLLCFLNSADRRSQPAQKQRRTQLHPVRPTLFRLNRVINRPTTNLQHNILHRITVHIVILSMRCLRSEEPDLSKAECQTRRSRRIWASRAKGRVLCDPIIAHLARFFISPYPIPHRHPLASATSYHVSQPPCASASSFSYPPRSWPKPPTPNPPTPPKISADSALPHLAPPGPAALTEPISAPPTAAPPGSPPRSPAPNLST